MIEVRDVDITTLEVDAIANAANTRLMHGGGVAGAIARAGGPVIQRESEAKAPIGLGEAAVTSGGEMPCRWVIHAATMELGGPTSAKIIRQATASTLRAAEELGARSLALVAFGTGVGGFSLDQAAEIEVEEVRRHLDGETGLGRVVFAVHGGRRADGVRVGAQRTLKPSRPSGSSSLTSTSSTSARDGPSRQNSTICSTASAGPSNTASTAPSSRLATQPATPWDSASELVESRKNTPWTRPWTTTRRLIA